MFKNFFNYRFFLTIFLLLVVAIGFGSVVKYHYEGGEKYQILQKAIVTISSVPINLRVMIKNRSLNLDLPKKLQKHKDKKKFEQFIAKNRNALLVLSRYDHSLKRSIVDIIDLNNFETIHSYNYDIAEINERVDNVDEFPRLKIDLSPERVTVLHPLLFADGSLTSHYGPLFKIDFCSNLKWINDEEIFHHSQMLDHEGNIWVAGKFNPKSKYTPS